MRQGHGQAALLLRGAQDGRDAQGVLPPALPQRHPAAGRLRRRERTPQPRHRPASGVRRRGGQLLQGDQQGGHRLRPQHGDLLPHEQGLRPEHDRGRDHQHRRRLQGLRPQERLQHVGHHGPGQVHLPQLHRRPPHHRQAAGGGHDLRGDPEQRGQGQQERRGGQGCALRADAQGCGAQRQRPGRGPRRLQAAARLPRRHQDDPHRGRHPQRRGLHHHGPAGQDGRLPRRGARPGLKARAHRADAVRRNEEVPLRGRQEPGPHLRHHPPRQLPRDPGPLQHAGVPDRDPALQDQRRRDRLQAGPAHRPGPGEALLRADRAQGRHDARRTAGPS